MSEPVVEKEPNVDGLQFANCAVAGTTVSTYGTGELWRWPYDPQSYTVNYYPWPSVPNKVDITLDEAKHLTNLAKSDKALCGVLRRMAPYMNVILEFGKEG